MRGRLRKLLLTTHVTSSVGWLGAVCAYLALAIAALSSSDVGFARGAYVSMETLGWFVIVPFSLAALATGLIQSLGTEWGLFRHWWVLTKFVLTVIGCAVLLGHMKAVGRMSHAAATLDVLGDELTQLRVQLVVHAVGGLVILLAATTLSVFKPWGKLRGR